MTKLSRILASLLLPLLLTATPLFARDGLSLDQAVQQAREKTGGRVISAETNEKNGQRFHNIRILTNDGIGRWRKSNLVVLWLPLVERRESENPVRWRISTSRTSAYGLLEPMTLPASTLRPCRTRVFPPTCRLSLWY